MTRFNLGGSVALAAVVATLPGCIVATSSRQIPSTRPSGESEQAPVVASAPPSVKSVYPDDSAAVVATVSAFHAALSAGDSLRALSLLEDDVVILEAGGVETRSEYRSHHLQSDIAFSRAVPRVRGLLRVRVQGDVAWVSGGSTVQGQFNGRMVNLADAELMVLVRAPAGWRISAIHWSSRSRR